jgi:septal ring factor EnvC (AmiA/AmiB activator)
MKPQGLHFSITLLALVALPAQADIFKCADADGHVTYSNVASKNCKKLNLDPVNSAPAAKAATRTPTPAAFPKVDDNTQKARDTDRRRILESELAAEQKNFEQAKKDLAEQEAVRSGDERNYQRVLDRLQPFKDKVALHERNIEAIRKEIANLH